MITSYTLGLARVGESAVVAFETEFDVRLPADYRAFLLEHNGGRPLECLFEGPYGSTALNDLYGLGSEPGRVSDLAAITRIFCKKLPKGYIPVADTGGGDKILLAATGVEPHGVFYLDHENFYDADSESLSDYDGVTRLSDSFSDFLAHLTPDS